MSAHVWPVPECPASQLQLCRPRPIWLQVACESQALVSAVPQVCTASHDVPDTAFETKPSQQACKSMPSVQKPLPPPPHALLPQSSMSTQPAAPMPSPLYPGGHAPQQVKPSAAAATSTHIRSSKHEAPIFMAWAEEVWLAGGVGAVQVAPA